MSQSPIIGYCNSIYTTNILELQVHGPLPVGAHLSNFTPPSWPCSVLRHWDVVEYCEAADFVHNSTCWQKDSWYVRSTLLRWWPVLQARACPDVRDWEHYTAPITSETCNLFLFPLECARVETGQLTNRYHSKENFQGLPGWTLEPAQLDLSSSESS